MIWITRTQKIYSRQNYNPNTLKAGKKLGVIAGLSKYIPGSMKHTGNKDKKNTI